jgi:hypothetical protein
MTYILRFPSDFVPTATVPPKASGSRIARRISSTVRWIGDWIEATADHYAAATMHEQLSRLSDTELHRRGLSRADLVRHVHAGL